MASPLRTLKTPSRALLHPLWLGSLAVLLVNDHVLKGSIVPGAITGKLSDFAGMLVAPLLLAALLDLRSNRAWRAAHIAVGSVFAAIQLSPAIANTWSALMGLVGFPWVITRDVTDLAALPFLLLSWHVLGRAQHRLADSNLRQTATVTAATAGLFACVATSYPDDPPPDGPPPPTGDTDGPMPVDDSSNDDDWDPPEPEPGVLPDLNTDVYVHNGTDQELIVLIRPLKLEVDVDCDVLAEDPGVLLTSPLFDQAESWTVPANANVAVGGYTEHRACRAALVEVNGLPPRLLFWDFGAPGLRTVPGQGSQVDDLGELAIIPQPEGALGWTGAETISYAIETAEPTCEAQPDGERLAWGEPVPVGNWVVSDIVAGFDGCLELTLSSDGGDDLTWFACIPEDTMTIMPGDEVTLDLAEAGPGFSLGALQPNGIPEAPERSVRAGAWIDTPEVTGFDVAVVPDFDCSAEVQPACGTVASPVHASVEASEFGSAQLRPDGTTTRLDSEAGSTHFALMHSQDRNAVDPTCALGPDEASYDIELVVGVGPLLPE